MGFKKEKEKACFKPVSCSFRLIMTDLMRAIILLKMMIRERYPNYEIQEFLATLDEETRREIEKPETQSLNEYGIVGTGEYSQYFIYPPLEQHSVNPNDLLK